MTTGEVKDSELARRGGGGGGIFGRAPHLITSVSAPTGSLLKQKPPPQKKAKPRLPETISPSFHLRTKKGRKKTHNSPARSDSEDNQPCVAEGGEAAVTRCAKMKPLLPHTHTHTDVLPQTSNGEVGGRTGARGWGS